MKRLCTALVCAMLLTLALTACDVVPATVFSEKNGNVSMNHLSAPKAGSPASDAPTVDEALPQDRASQTDGTASSQQPADISESAAKDIALTHAGVREADVTRLKVELDREKGQLVYEVEFRAGADKYEYDIHAESGTILEAEKNDRRLTAVAPTPTEPTTPSAPVETTPVTAPEAVPETIDEASAKDIALTHAGVREADVTRLKVELDREKGQLVYEVEFKFGGYEYEYTVSAADGSILEAEKEWDD